MTPADCADSRSEGRRAARSTPFAGVEGHKPCHQECRVKAAVAWELRFVAVVDLKGKELAKRGLVTPGGGRADGSPDWG